MKHSVLLVEDDENLGFVTKDFLDMSGFDVTLSMNGKSGLENYVKNKFDIIVLDIMMPQIDGFTVAESIRKNDKSTPIIFLTARTMKDDRIRGFNIGADDYITKPFSTEELKLRIEAILRRTKNGIQADANEFKIGSFIFNFLEHALISDTEGEKHLTKREAEVLRMLCQYKNKILRRDIALKAIWGDDDYFMGRSMDVYITKLRKLLKSDTSVSIINVHNTGFKLEIQE